MHGQARTQVAQTRERTAEAVLQKRVSHTHFSYTLGAEGVEQFVSTPELHSDSAIESDPFRPVRFGL